LAGHDATPIDMVSCSVLSSTLEAANRAETEAKKTRNTVKVAAP